MLLRLLPGEHVDVIEWNEGVTTEVGKLTASHSHALIGP